MEVLSIFPETPEKDGETTKIMSILSSLRKFRDWWHNKAVGQRANALRNKLKNIQFTEDFPNSRVSKNVKKISTKKNNNKTSNFFRLSKRICFQLSMRIVKSSVGVYQK